jgi:YggT family protein
MFEWGRLLWDLAQSRGVMINIIITIINLLANLFVLVVIVDSILSFFLSPYHPVRSALDRIINPFLSPIRKIVPLVGMFDFSPIILIILVEILSSAVITIIHAL